MEGDGVYTPTPTEGKRQYSPWNIAVKFNVDMAFSPVEIATMLTEYETDHHTGMDIGQIAEEIYYYTSGYPFMVSRICQCIDEELDGDWAKSGVIQAVHILQGEDNTLFDDLIKNLENYQPLYRLLYGMLIIGRSKAFVSRQPDVKLAAMFGYISRGADNMAVISNRIFEIVMTDHFAGNDISAEPIREMDTGTLKGMSSAAACSTWSCACGGSPCTTGRFSIR
jgi:hypothetical protein